MTTPVCLQSLIWTTMYMTQIWQIHCSSCLEQSATVVANDCQISSPASSKCHLQNYTVSASIVTDRNSFIYLLVHFILYRVLHFFLPRCMKCRRGIAMRILSVRLSVRHTRDPWQNGRKIGSDFYTIRKNIYLSFLRRRMVGGGRPLLREILGQPTPVGVKSPIFNQ